MNNEDKILDLLEMIVEKVGGLEAGQAKLEAGLAKLEEGLNIAKTSILKLELVEVPRIQASLDGVISNQEAIREHGTRISKLENISEEHAMDIVLLKSAK